MASAVEWALKLADRVSGPASAMHKRIEAVENVIRRVESVTKRSGGAFGGWARQGEQGARRVEQAYERMQKRIQGTHQSAQGLMQALQGGLMVGGAATAGAGYLLSRVLGGMGQREGDLMSLGTLLKGQNAAQVKAYAGWINNFADVTPFEDRHVTDAVKQLLGSKFTPAQTQGIARITGDAASALGSDPNDANFKWEIINRALGQIRAKGRVQGDELLQLAEAKVSPYEYLDKYVGKNWRQLSEKGMLSASVGISAILKGLQEDFGGAMDRMSKTYNGLLSTLKSRPQRLLGNMFDKGALAQPTRFMKNLVDLTDFNKDPGKRALARLTAVGKRIMDGLFGPLADATSGNRGAAALDRALDKIEEAGKWWTTNGPAVVANVKGFGDGLKTAADAALTLVKPLGWIVDKVSALTGGSGQGGVGKVLGFLAGGALIGKAANLLTFGGAGKAAGWLGRTALGGIKSSLGSLLTRGVLGEILTNPAGRLAGVRVALGSLGGTSGLGSLLLTGTKLLPVIGWVTMALSGMDEIGRRLYGTFDPFRQVVDLLGAGLERIMAILPGHMKFLQSFGLGLLQGKGFGGALSDAWGALTGLPGGSAPAAPVATPGLGNGPNASINALTGVAKRLGIDPQALLAVAFKESSLNPGAVNSLSGASGLIQFLPSTAKGLGTTVEAIRRMTPEQQAPYIERYLRQAGVRPGSSLEQIYAAVFAGNASKAGRVLYAQGSKAYADNAAMDLDRNGEITSAEVAGAAASAWRAAAGTFAPAVTVVLQGPVTGQAVQDIGQTVHSTIGTLALEHGFGGAS